MQLRKMKSLTYFKLISYHITSHHITSHHITSHHITSHHITSHHITSHHITSHHITSHHITSHHITSYHIISYHIIYQSYHDFLINQVGFRWSSIVKMDLFDKSLCSQMFNQSPSQVLNLTSTFVIPRKTCGKSKKIVIHSTILLYEKERLCKLEFCKYYLCLLL